MSADPAHILAPPPAPKRKAYALGSMQDGVYLAGPRKGQVYRKGDPLKHRGLMVIDWDLERLRRVAPVADCNGRQLGWAVIFIGDIDLSPLCRRYGYIWVEEISASIPGGIDKHAPGRFELTDRQKREVKRGIEIAR